MKESAITGIVIDAGHGGNDGGASGNGIVEKELTLKISEEMYNDFVKAGIPVKMVRTTDETVSPTERVNRILNAFGNKKDVIVISNHINAGGGDGAEVIYALRNNSDLANLILSNLEKAGQNGRKVYQRRLPSDTSKDYYFIHRNTGVTQPVIVEYGFLDSTGDDVNQLKNNYKKYAQAVVDAVIEYIQDEPSGVYIVQNGDTLYSIARKFNTTVDAIKDLNNLTSNVLSVGQKLKIPESEDEQVEPEGEIYIVKSGDSLYSIAQKFNTTVDEIKRLNNLTSNNLSIGQRLIIKEKANDVIEDQDVYIVQSGDTLYGIARKFNLTVDELKTMNNLSSNGLSIGQVLVIKPKENNNSQDIIYTVKRGDSLYSIAREYDVSVDELMKYNELKTNLLSIGQKLRIPKSENTTSGNIYTVQSGDSLWSIAKKFVTTVNALKEENNLQSNLLSIGQKLRIP